MSQRGADGPATSGGHKFLKDAYRAGVPRDWVLRLGSPVFREIQAEKEQQKQIEHTALQLLEALADKFPPFRPVISQHLRVRGTGLAVIKSDQFKLLVHEQFRRLAALEREQADRKL